MSDLFWKVYDPEGKRVAACADPETAAAVTAVLGDGATIRWRWLGKWHTAWREGTDGHAGESYDTVTERCLASMRGIL